MVIELLLGGHKKDRKALLKGLVKVSCIVSLYPFLSSQNFQQSSKALFK